MTNEELYLIMQPIVKTVTGLTQVILSNPNAPAPLDEYCAIKPKHSIEQRGQANIYKANSGTDSVTWEVRPQIVCEMLLEFYRGEAMSYAEMMKQANKRPDIGQALLQASPQPIGWQRAGNVINLTALQSNNWEQRAQISIYVLYELIPASVTPINSIERASVTVEDFDSGAMQTISIETDDAP